MTLPIYAPHYIATGKPMQEGDSYSDEHGNNFVVKSVVRVETNWKPSCYATAFYAFVNGHKVAMATFAHGAKAEWREVQA